MRRTYELTFSSSSLFSSSPSYWKFAHRGLLPIARARAAAMFPNSQRPPPPTTYPQSPRTSQVPPAAGPVWPRQSSDAMNIHAVTDRDPGYSDRQPNHWTGNTSSPPPQQLRYLNRYVPTFPNIGDAGKRESKETCKKNKYKSK